MDSTKNTLKESRHAEMSTSLNVPESESVDSSGSGKNDNASLASNSTEATHPVDNSKQRVDANDELKNNDDNSSRLAQHDGQGKHNNSSNGNAAEQTDAQMMSPSAHKNEMDQQEEEWYEVEPITVSINKMGLGALGVTFEMARSKSTGLSTVIISSIVPDGAVARSKLIEVGDEIVAVQGVELANLCQAEFQQILGQAGEVVEFVLRRYPADHPRWSPEIEEETIESRMNLYALALKKHSAGIAIVTRESAQAMDVRELERIKTILQDLVEARSGRLLEGLAERERLQQDIDVKSRAAHYMINATSKAIKTISPNRTSMKPKKQSDSKPFFKGNTQSSSISRASSSSPLSPSISNKQSQSLEGGIKLWPWGKASSSSSSSSSSNTSSTPVPIKSSSTPSAQTKPQIVQPPIPQPASVTDVSTQENEMSWSSFSSAPVVEEPSQDECQTPFPPYPPFPHQSSEYEF